MFCYSCYNTGNNQQRGVFLKYTTVITYIPVHILFQYVDGNVSTSPTLLYHWLWYSKCIFDKGKKKGLNLMVKEAAQFEPCATLGDSLTLEESQTSTAAKFVCRLYGVTKCGSVNQLRCQKAEEGIPVRKIPPSRDSFVLHLQRAMYQCRLETCPHSDYQSVNQSNKLFYSAPKSWPESWSTYSAAPRNN